MSDQSSKNTTVLSITAHLDLLGFSSHLVMSNNDVRTKIGEEAIERLRILEKTVDLVKAEMKASPDFYPKDFRIMRFNDSLIFGIDVNHNIVPEIGKANEAQTWTRKQFNDLFNQEQKIETALIKATNILDEESFRVCQFIGIVSRVHNYINNKEFEMHMPGARTVISSGLRYRFVYEDKPEDYYSANFSLSNAYIANDLGSKFGFAGNKCFIESNTAEIAGWNDNAKKMIGFLKYTPNSEPSDPFSGRPDHLLMLRNQYHEPKKIEIDLFSKRYIFREINTRVATNLQLFPKIMQRSNLQNNNLVAGIIKSISQNTPTLDEINSPKDGQPAGLVWPILYFVLSMDNDIGSQFNELIKI